MATRPDGENGMHHRADDPPMVKVTRDVPLHWLIGVIGAILLFAATVYFKQQRQEELLIEMNTQLKQISSAQTSWEQKFQEYTFRFTDLERRITSLEVFPQQRSKP